LSQLSDFAESRFSSGIIFAVIPFRDQVMVTLRLPDGSLKQVPPGTRPRQVAESIGKRLAQAAVAAKVNGVIVDLDSELHASEASDPRDSSRAGAGGYAAPALTVSVSLPHHAQDLSNTTATATLSVAVSAPRASSMVVAMPNGGIHLPERNGHE